MYPNETTRVYICYRKTISKQTVAERCKIYALNSQNCDFNLTLHARAMTHWRTQWRTTQNCLRVEPIWIDSENKFTPLFTRHIQLCNSKLEVLSNVIFKKAKPKMTNTVYSYCCYTACIIGFQFVTRSSTRYRILYRRSALNAFIAGVTSFITHCLFKRTVKSVLYRWISSNQLTHHS